MGKYSQHRKRGRGCESTVSVLVAPVLTVGGADEIDWTFDGADPFVWSIEQSSDGETGWFEATQVLGPNRLDGFLPPGLFYRIIGLDVLNNVVTLYSNVVSL